MVKWEYLEIGVQNNEVLFINGEQVIFKKGKQSGVYEMSHQDFFDFVAEKGKEGWEVVAVNMREDSAFYLCKRPIE